MADPAVPPIPPQSPPTNPSSQSQDGLSDETATPVSHDATTPQSPPVSPPGGPVRTGTGQTSPISTTTSATEPMGTAISGGVLPDDLAAQWRRTKCLNCGFVHEGAETMKKCPRCGNTEPDKFEEVD